MRNLIAALIAVTMTILLAASIDDLDLTRLNRVLKEYFEEKGW